MRKRTVAALSSFFVLALAGFAVTPQFWEDFTQEDLLKGTLTQVSLSADGKLYLARAYDLVFDTEQPYIFSLVRDKAGNVYAGTGHQGKVFKIDPAGNGSLYYQSKEIDIFSLALDAMGTLYVGSSPDGKVYKVTAANQAAEFCNPEEKYIWALHFDDAGNLFVATGGRGIIYKVDASGKKSVFYDADDSHIVSLISDGKGGLYAGTSPMGQVLRIDAKGKAFTLLDSSAEEIRSLAVDRFGTLYAVAVSAKGTQVGSPPRAELIVPTSGPLPLATIQALSSVGDKPGEAKSVVSAPGGQKDATGAASSITAIAQDGTAETVFTSATQTVYDILLQKDGSLLASTGGHGRLLSIDSSKQVTVITDSPEEQITRLAAAGDSIFSAGSNQGKIYKLQSQQARSGSYESQVMDAKVVSAWGRIRWTLSNPAGGNVQMSSRSGNTEKPGDTWSDWSTAKSGEQITNPKARYFQWRAEFARGSGAGAEGLSGDVLERVQIAYLQQNIRPQVTSISLLPSGVGMQKTPVIPSGTVTVTATSGNSTAINSPRERGKDRQALPPRQVLAPGAQAFSWKASDDNEDTLEYSVFFKGEGESDWKLLEKDLPDTFYTIEGGALPDGAYTVKIVASDAPSNPQGQSLIGELVSRTFVINNRTPAVEITNHGIDGRRVVVQFTATVQTGRIASAEFSVDGGAWQLVFPSDGISDSPVEQYGVTTQALSAGEHVLGLRAADITGNTGTAKLVVKIQ